MNHAAPTAGTESKVIRLFLDLTVYAHHSKWAQIVQNSKIATTKQSPDFFGVQSPLKIIKFDNN